MKSSSSRIFAAVLHALLSALARAKTLHLAMPSGIVGRAAFHAGRPGQAAAPLPHGFSPTGNFATLQQLRGESANAGSNMVLAQSPRAARP